MRERLTAVDDLDGARERGDRGRGPAEGEDLARGEGLLGRFGEAQDARVEEAGVEVSPSVAGGVVPGDVAVGEVAEASGLVAAGEFAGEDVKSWGDVGEVLGEGCEDQAVAGGGVPEGFVSRCGFCDLERREKGDSTWLRGCK